MQSIYDQFTRRVLDPGLKNGRVRETVYKVKQINKKTKTFSSAANEAAAPPERMARRV